MNDRKSKLKTLDLFCGAGGLSKGLEKVGFDVLAGVDIDDDFLKTYEMNHKDAKPIKCNMFDVTPKEFFSNREIDKNNIDIVVGGSPCKGFSIAGKRNPEDERNNLVDKFIDFVDYIQPHLFMMENVPGIISMKDGQVLDIILQRLENAGYNNPSYKVLNSANYGVPQKRRRAIFMGRRDGKKPTYPKPTHGNEYNLSNYRTVRDTILNDDLDDLPNHNKTNHSKDMVERISKVEQGDSLYDNFSDSWKRLNPDKPSPTIKENHGAPFIHPIEDRVGTVRECARLQSFPDDFIFKGSKSKQYKQVGNAVPVVMATKLGIAIKNQIDEVKV